MAWWQKDFVGGGNGRRKKSGPQSTDAGKSEMSEDITPAQKAWEEKIVSSGYSSHTRRIRPTEHVCGGDEHDDLGLHNPDGDSPPPPSDAVEVLETRYGLSIRLQKAGLFEEAARYKQDRIRHYMKRGMRRADARDQAWYDMAVRFPPGITESPAEKEKEEEEEAVEEEIVEEVKEPEPPPPPPPPPEPLITSWLTNAFGDDPGMDVDFIRDMKWVYLNLIRKNAKAKDAPSPGAWLLFQWAKDNVDSFVKQLFPRLGTATQVREKEAVTKTEDAKGKVTDEAMEKLKQMMNQ